jgi:hypothetical protein
VLLDLLLNTQHAHSDSSEALAAQYRAHSERRAAYARRAALLLQGASSSSQAPPYYYM